MSLFIVLNFMFGLYICELLYSANKFVNKENLLVAPSFLDIKYDLDTSVILISFGEKMEL